MISSAIKAYWKPLLILVLLAALVIGGVVAWNIHGDTQYAAGYAQALINQAQADELARQDREREKALNDREAQERIERARTDALVAADRAGRLQQQIAAIRKQLTNYTNAVVSARQPATPLYCLPTCSASLSKETDNWQIMLTGQQRRAEPASASTTR